MQRYQIDLVGSDDWVRVISVYRRYLSVKLGLLITLSYAEGYWT